MNGIAGRGRKYVRIEDERSKRGGGIFNDLINDIIGYVCLDILGIILFGKKIICNLMCVFGKYCFLII